MIFSENIYFLLLFTLPGALNVIYNAHIRYTSVAKEDKTVELAESVLFCLAVFVLNVLLMKKDMLLFTDYSMLTVEERREFSSQHNFSYISFMITYFWVDIFSSVLVIVIWYLFGQKVCRWLHNLLNKLCERPQELEYSDIWNNLFETKKIIDIRCCVVRIERSGELVSAGIIKLYSAPNEANKEIVLGETDFVKKLFAEDEKKELEQRIFKDTLYEYYNIKEGLLIKFYNGYYMFDQTGSYSEDRIEEE